MARSWLGFCRGAGICANRLKTLIVVVPVSPEIERKARVYIPDEFKARPKIRGFVIGIGSADKRVTSADSPDICCRPADHKVVDVLFESVNGLTQIFCTEVRYSPTPETEEPEIALVAEVVLPDNTAASAEGILLIDDDRILVAVDICKRYITVRSGNLPTINVVAEKDEGQFTESDIDILIADVEGLLELVSDAIVRERLVRSVNQIEVIVIGPYPGEVQIAGTEVDVIGTHTKARRIQPEPVVRVDVIPIVKPLTSPEGDLRSTFEDILHFHERFTHADAKIGCGLPEFPSSGTTRGKRRW